MDDRRSDGRASRICDALIVDAATAFTYKGRSVTAQQVGKDLGVHFVLQGSVQRSGAKIRINAQLADATSNAQLWSESLRWPVRPICAASHVTARIGNSIGREMVIMAARESETRKSEPEGSRPDSACQALHLKPRR